MLSLEQGRVRERERDSSVLTGIEEKEGRWGAIDRDQYRGDVALMSDVSEASWQCTNTRVVVLPATTAAAAAGEFTRQPSLIKTHNRRRVFIAVSFILIVSESL